MTYDNLFHRCRAADNPNSRHTDTSADNSHTQDRMTLDWQGSDLQPITFYCLFAIDNCTFQASALLTGQQEYGCVRFHQFCINPKKVRFNKLTCNFLVFYSKFSKFILQVWWQGRPLGHIMTPMGQPMCHISLTIYNYCWRVTIGRSFHRLTLYIYLAVQVNCTPIWWQLRCKWRIYE